jgi:hypothetical protein
MRPSVGRNNQNINPVGAGLCNQLKPEINLRTNLPNPTSKLKYFAIDAIEMLIVGEGGFV